jgi:hypothetical protein
MAAHLPKRPSCPVLIVMAGTASAPGERAGRRREDNDDLRLDRFTSTGRQELS